MRVSIQEYDAQSHQARHAHGTMSVTLLLAGSLREQVGHAEVVAQSLSLVIKPVGVEHANTFGVLGARTVQVALDAHEACAIVEANPALTHWSWTHVGPATAPFLALASAIRGRDHGLADQRALEALAAAGNGGRVDRAVPRWIERVHEHVSDDPVHTTLKGLAHEAGVHPVYLARVFRECFGLSVTDFRKRCRVQRSAHQLTVRPRPSLSTIAHGAGYADHSHMCREFRAVTGVTPSTFGSIVSD